MPGDERTGSSVGTIARRDFGQEARGSGRGRQSRRNLVRAEQRPSEYIEQDPAHIPRKGVAKDGGWALPTPRHSHPAHGGEVGTELPRGRLHRFLLKTYRELTTPKYRTHVFFFYVLGTFTKTDNEMVTNVSSSRGAWASFSRPGVGGRVVGTLLLPSACWSTGLSSAPCPPSSQLFSEPP